MHNTKLDAGHANYSSHDLIVASSMNPGHGSPVVPASGWGVAFIHGTLGMSGVPGS